ncbi:methionine ABC transporter permease [Catellatospora sp. NPDC049133]|jgi:D-methionine transport system permease protein|uniref:methionine ABC transporter permease n=1 Tax=Catellatospora sp. NPDC049133 TaxID=3155499 RepID=UPI0033FB6F12
MIELLLPATGETLHMVGLAALFTVLAGLPLGVLLGYGPAPLRPVLGAIVNVGRSVPFVILMIAVIPLTRALLGTSIGTAAAVVPLTVGAIPFFARLVEGALRDVDPGLTEAGHAFGATRAQIVARVLLPEALPALVRGLTVTAVALVGYSAMAGVIGGGGLGYLAIRYGYQRFETDVMLATVAVLVALVQLVQLTGDRLARRLDRR